MRPQIALIRPGRTESGEQRRILGMRNEPLSRQGRGDLHQRGAEGAYPPVRLVYTDETARCRETAALIYPRVPAVILKQLRPFDFGAFEGKTRSELLEDRQFQDWVESDIVHPCPYGDGAHLFTARCVRAFREIVDEMQLKGIEIAAVITHNITIGAIMRRFCIPRALYRDWDIPFAEGCLIEFDTAQSTARLLGKI